MTKSLILTHKQWADVLEKIKSNYTPSVYLMRNRLKHVLGFTPRDHTEWIDADFTVVPPIQNIDLDLSSLTKTGKSIKRTIHLDFYDEGKKLIFLLKYM